MQIVINIPEKVKQAFDNAKDEDLYGNYYDYNSLIGKAIKNGIQLPKGHGRIGDLDKLKANIEEYRDTYDRNGDDYEFGKYTAYDMSIDAIDSAPIIIEADRSEEE